MVTFSINSIYEIDANTLDLRVGTQEGRTYLSNFYLSKVTRGEKSTKARNADQYGIKAEGNQQADMYSRPKLTLVSSEDYVGMQDSGGDTRGIVSEVVVGHDKVLTTGKIEEIDELQVLLRELESMKEVILYESGVNIIYLLKAALKGNAKAIVRLRGIKDAYMGMDKLLHRLLEMPMWYDYYTMTYSVL